MSTLPMNFDSVLQTFGTPLPVTVLDTTGSYVDGEWTETDPVPRPQSLPAIVLSMSVWTRCIVSGFSIASCRSWRICLLF